MNPLIKEARDQLNEFNRVVNIKGEYRTKDDMECESKLRLWFNQHFFQLTYSPIADKYKLTQNGTLVMRADGFCVSSEHFKITAQRLGYDLD